MLIKLSELVPKYDLKIKGILHVGAHDCEELSKYIAIGVNINDIHWVEGNKSVYEKNKTRSEIVHLHHALIDETDDNNVIFNIANNGQSSSILDFGTHSKNHPGVRFVKKVECKTKRLDTLIDENDIPMQQINFLNLDIQGVELRAMKSMEKYLKHVDYIYTEINEEDVYLNCDHLKEIDDYLMSFGFIRKEKKIWGNCGWGDAFYMKE
jgi:FkbM family methyltransferase